MRGALMDATLPVVMRRTCVCPSRLLAAAVNCPVIIGGTGKLGERNLIGPPDQHELPVRPAIREASNLSTPSRERVCQNEN